MTNHMTIRRSQRLIIASLVGMLIVPLSAFAQENKEYVILLHGLCRSSRSMSPMEHALSEAGYKVLNVDYPSRSASIEKLSEDVVGRLVGNCRLPGREGLHSFGHCRG